MSTQKLKALEHLHDAVRHAAEVKILVCRDIRGVAQAIQSDVCAELWNETFYDRWVSRKAEH